LVDRTGRSDHFHNFPPTAVRPDRKSPADYLPECGEIRLYVEKLLSPAACDSKPAHHFVEDQKDLMVIANLPEPAKKICLPRHTAHVPGDGLQENCGDFILKSFQQDLDRIEIVVLGVERVAGGRPRNSRTVG
jgi:hypothetical protein